MKPINVPGLTALPNNGGQKEMGTSYSFINNLSVFRGRHNLKFGGEVRRVHVNVWWTDSRSATFAKVDDFVRNAVDSVSISGEMATRGGRRTLLFGYAQDEFKASRTLTLSLGARYEYYSVMKEVKDRILVFDKEKGDFAPQGTPAYQPGPRQYRAARELRLGARLAQTEDGDPRRLRHVLRPRPDSTT